jgi:hypothetical protein
LTVVVAVVVGDNAVVGNAVVGGDDGVAFVHCCVALVVRRVFVANNFAVDVLIKFEKLLIILGGSTNLPIFLGEFPVSGSLVIM